MFELGEKLEFIYYWMYYVNDGHQLDVSNNVSIINPHTIKIYNETFYSESEFDIIQELLNCEELWEDVYNQEIDLTLDLLEFEK